MIGNVVAARSHAPFPMLGAGWSQVISTGPSIAASVGTQAAVTSGAIAAGGLLATALPVVGVVIGVFIASLLAAHAARVAGAKSENAALNQLVPAVQNSFTKIADAYSSGQIDATGAAQAAAAVRDDFWSTMARFENNPGQAGGPGTCRNTGSQAGPAGPMTHTVPCDKSHTASTCVGCIWVDNYADQLSQLIQQGKTGTFQLQGSIPGNKYGFSGAPALSVTLQTPSAVPGLPAGASGILSASVMGIPFWLIAAGLLAWKVL